MPRKKPLTCRRYGSGRNQQQRRRKKSKQENGKMAQANSAKKSSLTKVKRDGMPSKVRPEEAVEQ
jgi:hypothetical protein